MLAAVVTCPAVAGSDTAAVGPTLRDVYRGGYFLGALRDAGRIVTAPVRWDAGDWALAAGTAGVTWGLMTADPDLQRMMRRNVTQGTRDIAGYVKRFGEGAYIAPALVVAGVGGRVAGDSHFEKTAWLGLESFWLAAGVFDLAIKMLAHRHRPYMGEGPRAWNGPGTSRDNARQSFPSGHSCVAWSTLTAISAAYEDSIYVAPFAYGIATLTALSRVHDNAHWSSDVFFGSALGFFIGRAVVKWHEPGAAGIVPAALPGGVPGAALTFSF
jgi:membrane-associated phospholipid phosphatase